MKKNINFQPYTFWAIVVLFKKMEDDLKLERGGGRGGGEIGQVEYSKLEKWQEGGGT